MFGGHFSHIFPVINQGDGFEVVQAFLFLQHVYV